jgi:sialic acid synthase SpsE
MVEKTITLDRCTPSVEHIFSLEPAEVGQFVRKIRDLEVALGNTRRIMDHEEIKRAMAVRRSAVLAKDIQAGDKVEEHVVDFARPGFGIRPSMAFQIWGKRFRKDLKKGQLLSFEDIE